MMLKIIATPIKGKYLQPGDLFSTVGPEYWDFYQERESIGEKVYIRTDTSALEAPDSEAIVYKIEIKKVNSTREQLHPKILAKRR